MKWRDGGDNLEPDCRSSLPGGMEKALPTSVSTDLITSREWLSSLLQIPFSFVLFTHRSKKISLKQTKKQISKQL